MINDISTDLDDPPAILVNGAPVPFPEKSRRQLAAGGKPDSWGPAADLATVQQAVLAAVAARGDWSLVESRPGHIAFVATSAILRFKDDVTIRLRTEGAGTRVDVRSRSRTGSSDFGVNAKRIAVLLKESAVRLQQMPKGQTA